MNAAKKSRMSVHGDTNTDDIIDITELLGKFRSMSDMVEYFLTKHECKVLSVMDDQNKVVNDCFRQIAGQFRQRDACDQSETTESHKSRDSHPNESNQSISGSFEPLHRQILGNRVPKSDDPVGTPIISEFGTLSNGEHCGPVPNANPQRIMSPAFDLDEIPQPDIDRYIFGGSFPDYVQTEEVRSDMVDKWSVSSKLEQRQQLQQPQQLQIDPTQPTNPSHPTNPTNPTTNLYEDIQQIQREHGQRPMDMYSSAMDIKLERHRATILALAQRYSAIDLKYLNNICKTTFKGKLPFKGIKDELRDSFFYFAEYFECREYPQSRGGKWIAISKIYNGPGRILYVRIIRTMTIK